MMIIQTCTRQLRVITHQTFKVFASAAKSVQKAASKALKMLLIPFKAMRSRKVRVFEGACDQLDRNIIALWQNSLGFNINPDRRGLEECLNQVRDSANQNFSSATQRLNHYFNNKSIAAEVEKSFCDRFGLKIDELMTIEEAKAAYFRIYAELGDQSLTHHQLFDPLHWGNLPYIWTSLQIDSTKTDLIRMPAATRDTPNGCLIAEEFASFVRSLERQDRRHCYVNLMNKHCGNEQRRSQTLSNFARECLKANQSNFIFASLDKNSPQYLSGNCSKSKTLHLQQLRESVHHWLLDPYFNQWPLPEDELRNQVKDALAQTEEILHLPENVDQNLCRAFYDCAQTEMLRRLMKQFRPHTMNISCKNCIDRGPSQQVLLSSWLDRLQNRPFFDSARAVCLLAPAWLVSGRAMQKDRFERCFDALKVISGETP